MFDVQGPLTETESFHPSHICYCSMHSVNLGYSLWVAASALVFLVEYLHLWGDDGFGISERYKSAWLHFNGWTVANKAQ